MLTIFSYAVVMLFYSTRAMAISRQDAKSTCSDTRGLLVIEKSDFYRLEDRFSKIENRFHIDQSLFNVLKEKNVIVEIETLESHNCTGSDCTDF